MTKLEERIAHLLTRPLGRPPNEVRRAYANFNYQAGSWTKPRRVVAKVEWRPGELYPRVGFIVTNMARPSENVVAFYNKRGTCEQRIKEGKGAIKWTRLSCRSFAANAVRLQLHALAYNLGNFLRTLATPEPAFDASDLKFFGALAPLRDPETFARYLAPLRHACWVVYAKRPFGGARSRCSTISAVTRIASRSPTAVSSIAPTEPCAFGGKTVALATNPRR